MKTYSETTNALGVTPHFFEKIMTLHYLLGELQRQLESVKRLRRNVVDYAGKPKGEISADAIPKEVKKAMLMYSNIRVMASSLPVNIDFDVRETGSNCCFAPLIENTDICSACKEHSALVNADDTNTEDDITHAGCELIAKYAVMLVHSFSPEHKWFSDYQDFLGLFGVASKINELVKLPESEGKQIFTGWVVGK